MTSDGSSELVRRDPRTLTPQAVIAVRCRGHQVLGLNDLAWSAGTIWANVAGTGKGWRSIRHVRLQPAREGSAQERLLSGLNDLNDLDDLRR